MNTMNAQEQRTAGEAQTVDRSPSAQRETARQAESARPAVPAEVQAILRQEAAVRRSFTGVQDTLGESGRKAFQDAYRRGTDRGNYTGEFLRAYHAGMTGQKNTNSTSDVSFAAYTAGKNDAAASLAREKQAAQAAQAAGEESGIHRDDYVDNVMDSSVVDEVDAVSKSLGVRVQMVDQVLNGLGNGNINGSEIQIAKDARDPALRVVGHEWTHRVQELAPDTYRSFRDAVGSLPDVQDAVQILVEQYNEAGIETSYERALDEATANYAGEMIENSNVLDDFIRKHSTDRTLLQKLRDTIHEIVGKLTGRAKRQAQTVEGKLQAAFEAAAKQAERLDSKNTATEGGETRLSLKTFEDGTRFVDVQTDQQQFDGLDDAQKSKLAIRIIKSEFAGKVIGVDNRVFVNGHTASEYGHPVKRLTHEAVNAKMRASTELDNLIDAGTNFRTEPDGRDGHVHPNSVGDFQYFDTIFKVGGEYYKGVINVEHLAKGLRLKDITKIENITQDLYSSYGTNPKSVFLRDASMDTVSQDDGDVKSSYSLKGTENARELAALKQENETLKERMEYWKGQTRRSQGVTTDQKSVRKAADALVKDYGAEISGSEITGDCRACMTTLPAARTERAETLKPDGI